MIDFPQLDTVFDESESAFINQRDSFWDSLSKEDQLLAFCAVINKLFEGEVRDRRSYRGVLYSTFGFDLDAYMKAQISNFVDIHNLLGDALPLSSSPNPEMYIYGSKVAKVTPAFRYKGLICKSVDGKFFLRVNMGDKGVFDYEIRHDDLEVVIIDTMASFYETEDTLILDHDPETLGLEEVFSEQPNSTEDNSDENVN